MRKWIWPSASASRIACAAATALPGGREREEEGISLGVHLDAVLGGASLADDAAVLGKCVCVRLCSEFVQEPRRSLNVREEEGDGAGRKIGSHAT